MTFGVRFSLLALGFALLLPSILLLSATGQPANAATPLDAVPSMNANELDALMKAKEPFIFLDVRQPEEFDKGHLDNAVLMPLGTVPDRFRDLPKDKKIVVYCRSGRRSAQAAAFLRKHGYRNVVNLSGGYQEWVKAAKTTPGEKKACPAAAC